MFKLGIVTFDQYVPEQRTVRSRRMSWQLLRVAIPPSAKEVALFEEAMRELQLSSGVFRMTFRGRFRVLDQQINRQLAQHFPADATLHIEDWAASDCLTSSEWSAALEAAFPNASLHTSDLTLYLLEVVNGGKSFIVEPGGQLLQAIRPPFVLRCYPPEPWFLPVNRYLMTGVVERWKTVQKELGPLPDLSDCDSPVETQRPPYLLRRIALVHPEAEALRRSSRRFFIRRHSAFDVSPNACHVIRTMNILNLSYFSRERLKEGAEAVFRSLLPGGIWIVGRTLVDAEQVHAVSMLKKESAGFRLLERVGAGSEIEDIALSVRG